MSNPYSAVPEKQKNAMPKWSRLTLLGIVLLIVIAIAGCAYTMWGGEEETQATATPAATAQTRRTVSAEATPNINQTVEARVEATVKAQNVAEVAANNRTEEAGETEPSATSRPAATERPQAEPTKVNAQAASSNGPMTGGVALFDGTRSYDSFVASGGRDVDNPNSNLCPSEAKVHADLELLEGVKVVRTGDPWSVPTDPCKFSLQAVGFGHTPVKMATDYQFTVAEHPSQDVVVYYGDDVRRDIQGSTVRFLPAYPENHWVLDPAALIAQEFNFGFAQQRNPRYVTRAGNFNPTGWNGYDGSYCPETPVQLAAAVGGWPANWTLRDWSGGADMFAVDRDTNNEPLAFYVLTDSHIDGADTWVDYYNTQAGRPDQLANGETFPLADATWHCHDGSDGYVPESSTPNNVQHIPVNTQVSTAQQPAQPAQQQAQAQTSGQCYATASDVAAAVGGQASNWTAPDWDGGAWVFHSNTPVKLRIPSAGGKIDHHNLGTITSGETRDAVQDASYTCTR